MCMKKRCVRELVSTFSTWRITSFYRFLLYNSFLLGCFEAMELFKLLQCNIIVFVSAGWKNRAPSKRLQYLTQYRIYGTWLWINNRWLVEHKTIYFSSHIDYITSDSKKKMTQQFMTPVHILKKADYINTNEPLEQGWGTPGLVNTPESNT